MIEDTLWISVIFNIYYDFFRFIARGRNINTMPCPTKAKFGNSGPHPAPSEARMPTKFAQFWLRKAIAGLPFSAQVKAYFWSGNVWLLQKSEKLHLRRKTITKIFQGYSPVKIFIFVKPISLGFQLKCWFKGQMILYFCTP